MAVTDCFLQTECSQSHPTLTALYRRFDESGRLRSERKPDHEEPILQSVGDNAIISTRQIALVHINLPHGGYFKNTSIIRTICHVYRIFHPLISHNKRTFSFGSFHKLPIFFFCFFSMVYGWDNIWTGLNMRINTTNICVWIEIPVVK